MARRAIRMGRQAGYRYFYVAEDGDVLHVPPDQIDRSCVEAGPFRRHSDLLFWRLLQTAKSHMEEMCDVADAEIIENKRRAAELDAAFEEENDG